MTSPTEDDRRSELELSPERMLELADLVSRLVVERIQGLADEPARAPPQDASPAIAELQYATDLDFVQDPGPAEPVWSADRSTLVTTGDFRTPR